MILRPKRRDATPRRGMLLLLVLSILALFIVVGGVGILLALRARESARAFAAASASQTASGPLARAQLDEALLRLIRGGTAAGGVTESLLEDKYGPPQSCQVTALSGTTAAFMTATVTGLDTSNPLTVAGRVLTFVPAATDPTGPTSYRILRTGTTTNTLLLANVKPNSPQALPTVFPCEAVINGREFVTEAYDAFDTANPFLTQVVLQSSTVGSVKRPAFGTENAQCVVDNDGDGVPDGIWLQDALPRQRTASGGDLRFDVSYLVLDLDGRINLNAHGSFVRAQLPIQPPPTGAVGMGFGPADVDAALALGQPAGAAAPRWATLLQGGAVTPTATTSSTTQWRPAPLVEPNQQGRYTQGTAYSTSGPGGLLGTGSLSTGTNAANADFWMLNPLGNSPTDLKARLQVVTQVSPLTLRFIRPAGAAAWVSGTDTDDIRASGTASHPYAIRLDEDAPRSAGWNAVDALYTVGELERILRQFDSDAATLAPRLAVILDDLAERSRMTVTTDSWDTPAVTGTTFNQISSRVTGGNAYDVLSPETVAGLRLNLNRPLTTAAARQEFFKQLYTLCVALGAPPADAAQWSANVIEFRDPDSIMTWYPYDTNPLDGWTPGPGVWGRERPELAITAASAPDSQATVSLYRPWNAQLCAGSASTVTGTTELIDASLGNRATNTLNAAALSGADAVWQLVATGSTGNTVGGPSGLNSLVSSATAVAPNTPVGPATISLTGTATRIVLQRLANPAAARDTNQASATYNDYVPVHQVDVGPGSRTVSRWLHWPNRDLVSHGELLAVHSGSANMPEAMFSQGSEASLARTFPAILDATIVPSRFAAANVSVANGATVLAGTGYENFQYGQFSRWREAGRVNVNTILVNSGNNPGTLDNAVWMALAGQSAPANPFTPQQPAKSDRDPIVGAAEPTPDAPNAFLSRSAAIRLANCATIRSHVFAVWITLRIIDTSPNAGPTQFVRLFAIVDRSIPVGYAPGRTLNVRETIRLQRFLP